MSFNEVCCIMGKARQKQVNKPDQPSRAAQIAATVGARLKDLGQLPESPTKPQIEKETTAQTARRQELVLKLRSYVE